MKKLTLYALVLTLVAIAWTALLAFAEFRVKNEYNNKIGYYWQIADRTSTLDDKAAYIGQYVTALEAADLRGTYDTTTFKSPNNSFDANLTALKTLRARLNEIRRMNPESLAYQQALSQVTAQEMGQAQEMNGVFEGCWLLRNHSMLWGWHEIVQGAFLGLLWLAAIVLWMIAVTEY